MIRLPLPFEPIPRDRDDVLDPLVFAHQSCSNQRALVLAGAAEGEVLAVDLVAQGFEAGDGLGFQVIARPVGPGVQSQIVVPSDSPARTLQDLVGKDVGFVSLDGFTGYYVPYDALLRAKVNVKVAITGNQEASVAQLKVGKLTAAGFNGTILERYARREGFAYRALWSSPLYPDLCIMAHKRVPADKIAALRAALAGMDKDPEGRKVLETSAALLKATGELGFVTAEDRDYDGYRTFFKNSLVKRQ